MNTPPPHSSFLPASFQPEPLLAVACPACFGAIAVGTDLLGRAADCPLCGQGFNVPLPAVTTPPPRPNATAMATEAPSDSQPTAASRERRRDRHREATATPMQPSPPEPVDQPMRAPTADEAEPPVAPTQGSPTQQAPTRELQFEEPVRTISSGGQVITLRRLTPEEKAIRRGRRNLIMMLSGVSILMAIVLLLGTKRSRRRS